MTSILTGTAVHTVFAPSNATFEAAGITGGDALSGEAWYGTIANHVVLQDVEAGDVICSIEAMKMETALHAETSGKVAEVCVKRGDQIDAKDLLVRLEA